MKKQIAFKGRIVNGEIHYFKPKDRVKAIKELEGKEIVERIEEVSDDVSANQRAYYFATNRWLSKENETFGGWSEEEIDEHARDLFLSTRITKSIDTLHGREQVDLTIKRSIRNIDKDEMAEFIDSWLKYLSFTHAIYCKSVEEILLSKYQ